MIEVHNLRRVSASPPLQQYTPWQWWWITGDDQQPVWSERSSSAIRHLADGFVVVFGPGIISIIARLRRIVIGSGRLQEWSLLNECAEWWKKWNLIFELGSESESELLDENVSPVKDHSDRHRIMEHPLLQVPEHIQYKIGSRWKETDAIEPENESTHTLDSWLLTVTQCNAGRCTSKPYRSKDAGRMNRWKPNNRAMGKGGDLTCSMSVTGVSWPRAR